MIVLIISYYYYESVVNLNSNLFSDKMFSHGDKFIDYVDVTLSQTC